MPATTTKKKVSKKTVSKKAVPKKPVAKKAVLKKPVAKKAASKKAVAKKAASKKPAAKKVAAPSAVAGINLGSKGIRGTAAALPLAAIKITKGFNPRGNDIGDISELAKSIKSEGLLSSLVVRPTETDGEYALVAGERRLTALHEIGYKDPVLCTIRGDLTGDDDRALAVAIAENSPDGRTDMNMLQVGAACVTLEKSGWSPAHIAKETGLHVQRVRRALALMGTPEDVQEKIKSGDISVQVGLEFAKLSPATRSAIQDDLGPATTAKDIQKLRKNAEKAEQATDVAQGVEPSTKAKRVVTAWRGSKEKQHMLQMLCFHLNSLDPEHAGSLDHHELLGTVAALLWDRGDFDTIAVPPVVPEKGDTDGKKHLKAFLLAVSSEAAKYVPDSEEAGEYEEAAE